MEVRRSDEDFLVPYKSTYLRAAKARLDCGEGSCIRNDAGGLFTPRRKSALGVRNHQF